VGSDDTESFLIPTGSDEPPPRAQREFPIALRGYDRAAVDNHLAELEEDIAELHAQRSPSGVVKRALDKVGEETSAILQRAHETADEITRKSRDRASTRLEEAEREAERIRAAADAHVRSLDESVDAIWAERHRLVEDVRRVGDTLIKIAEEAMSRFPPEDGPPTPPRPASGTGPATPAARRATSEFAAARRGEDSGEAEAGAEADALLDAAEAELAVDPGQAPEAGEPRADPDAGEEPAAVAARDPEPPGVEEEPGAVEDDPRPVADEPPDDAGEPPYDEDEPPPTISMPGQGTLDRDRPRGVPREPLPDEGIQSVRPLRRDDD